MQKYIKRRTTLLLFLLSAVFIAYSLYETGSLKIEHIDFFHPDVPSSFHGFSIVFITDIHHGPFVPLQRVEEITEITNTLQPDIILLGGDYTYMGEKYVAPCFSVLQHLKARHGVYGVLGNHDQKHTGTVTLEAMRKAGIVPLENKAEWIYQQDERIKIGGIRDLGSGDSDIRPTTDDTHFEDFVIVVAHNPDFAEYLKESRVDLQLSGHTHGGQITFFGLFAPFLPSSYAQKYRTGTVRNGRVTVIISNGIGTIFPPIRFFAPPQLHVVHLYRTSDTET